MKMIAVYVLFVFIICTACSEKDPDTHAKSSTPQDENKIEFEIREFEKSYGVSDSLDEPGAMIRIQFPEITKAYSAKLKNTLNEFIKAQVLSEMLEKTDYSSPEDLMTEFLNEYKSFEKDFPDSPGGWIEERVVEVMLCQNDIFSFSYSDYSYAGGAHPNSTLLYFNFDLTTGSLIALPDILIENYQEKLNQVAEKKFRYERQIEENESYSAAGYFLEDDKFILNNNFLITANGLKFFFNTYEIAPYSYGTTEIFITYSEIANLIKPNSLLKNIK